MDYRKILKHQLELRKEMNPKYSLRAFAKKLDISPSKLSEILSHKKRLGVDRAEKLADRLSLSSLEKELFVLSARLESFSKKEDQGDLAKQFRELARQINAKRTLQRNAWYFGAVKTLLDLDYDSGFIQGILGVTALQIENAKRYLKRMGNVHPDRKRISFEPLSILRKIEDHMYSDVDRTIEADFLIISRSDQEEMERKMRSIVEFYKLKSKNTSLENIKMVYWGCLNLKKE